MKSIFAAWFLVGLALALTAAGLYPLPGHVRIPSEISALPNGGRLEIFTIELPGDRIALPQYAKVAAFPARSFSSDGQDRLTAELFRIRNSKGTVIGVASKTTGRVTDVSGQPVSVSDWIFLIPSRGALLLNQENARNLLPTPAASANAGEATVKQRLSVGPSPDGEGVVVRGTGEFDGLQGTYSESLEVNYVDAGGITHGRIELSTRTVTSR